METEQVLAQYGPSNQFQIDGEVKQFDGATAIVEVITRRRSGSYENLLAIDVPTELALQVEIGAMQSFVGEIVRGPDEVEPVLVAKDIAPATEYFNIAQAIVKLAGSEFFKAQAKKKKAQFLSLFGDQFDGTNTISAVAFRGLSASLKSVGEGSLVLLSGQLRRKQFADGTGRYSTDIICDTGTDVIEEAVPKGFREVTPAKTAKKAKKAGKKAV